MIISRTRTLLRSHSTFFRFGISSTVYSVVGMLAGIIIIRWMRPEEIGLWQSVLIIQSWSYIVQAGIITGLSRELPFFLGRNDESRARELAATAQSIALAGMLLLLFGAPIALILADSLELKGALAIVFLSSGLMVYSNYLTTTYRANRDFNTLSWILWLESVILIVSLPLVYYFGYWGLVFRFAGITIAGTVLRHITRPIVVSGSLNVGNLLLLLKVGGPIFGFGYLLQTVDTFPRLLLLGREEGILLVGLFAPISAIFGLMRILPATLGSYIFPQMNFQLGASGDARRLWPMAWKSSVYFLLVSAPFSAVGWVAFPHLIRAWFPEYASAASAIGWALLAGMFMGTGVAINSLYSLKSYYWLALYTAINLGSAWFFPTLLLGSQPPLEAVTLGFALSRVLMFGIGIYCVYMATHRMHESSTLACE